MNKVYNIAVDGPSGAGKSSLAKGIARKLGFLYVDTGALYRAIGLYAARAGANPYEEREIRPLLEGLRLELRCGESEQTVWLGDEEVSGLIRTPKISEYASAVSAHSAVRDFLLDTQRKIAGENNVVMDGRDIATVILPNADVKIFLTASLEIRARRRYRELSLKDPDIRYGDVRDDMLKRDSNDSSRKIAPAIRAQDAVLLDNSDMSEDGTLDAALAIIREVLP